jgi:hypothetical protein
MEVLVLWRMGVFVEGLTPLEATRTRLSDIVFSGRGRCFLGDVCGC